MKENKKVESVVRTFVHEGGGSEAVLMDKLEEGGADGRYSILSIFKLGPDKKEKHFSCKN